MGVAVACAEGPAIELAPRFNMPFTRGEFMSLRTVIAGWSIVAVAGVSHAAVVVPVKPYVRPDEPVLVKFENEKGEEGKKALAAVGLAATKMDNLFSPVTDAIDVHSLPTFSLYTFDGTKLDPTPGKAEADGSVDVGTFFPQVKAGGTFLLVWKDATPLVIETLFNPGRGKEALAHVQTELEKMPESETKQVLAQFSPTVIHIEPLEYAVIETDKGVIKAKFAYDIAPHTVDNFISLSKQGFYDGTSFHRIISGFMIQGGDSTGNIEGAPARADRVMKSCRNFPI